MLAVYWPALAIATHWPRLGHEQHYNLGDAGVDKPVHAACFALLALLIIHSRLLGGAAVGRAALIGGTLVAAVYAVVDECTQTYMERTSSVADLAANLAGVLAAYLAVRFGRASLRQRSSSIEDLETTNAPASNPEAPHQGGFIGHTVLVSLLTFVSRLLGMARDAVLAACFGMTALTDAFWIAFVIPNLFRRLFGEGALSAAFIPAYARSLRENPETARRLASAVLALLLIVLGAATVVGELILGALAWSGRLPADAGLAVRLTMIMLPYMPLICAVALIGGVLQVHGRFGPPAAAPVLLNVVMIVVAVGSVMIYPAAGQRWAIQAVAVSVVVAGVAQLVWQLAALRGCEQLTCRVRGAGPALRSVLITMLPMAVGLAVFQINTLLDSLIAWGLSPSAHGGGGEEVLWLWGYSTTYPVESGAVTALQYAQRLYQFPLGVFGIALATAIFPALAKAAPTPGSPGRESALDPFRDILKQGLRLTVFVGLPASLGLMVVAGPVIRVMFQHGRFTPEDTTRVTYILCGYALGVWAYSMTHVLTRAYHALGDARRPVVVSVWMVGLNLVLNLSLVWSMGAVALALSTAICAVGQVVFLTVGLMRHAVWPIDKPVLKSWLGSALIAILMACGLFPLDNWLSGLPLGGTAGSAAQLAVLVLSGLLIVGIGARLLRMRELGWLFKRG